MKLTKDQRKFAEGKMKLRLENLQRVYMERLKDVTATMTLWSVSKERLSDEDFEKYYKNVYEGDFYTLKWLLESPVTE